MKTTFKCDVWFDTMNPLNYESLFVRILSALFNQRSKVRLFEDDRLGFRLFVNFFMNHYETRRDSFMKLFVRFA